MEAQRQTASSPEQARHPIIIASEIPKERINIMARPVLAAVMEAFKDPAIAKEYEVWKAERDARLGKK